MVRFYVFLIMVPIFMVYIFVAFATVMSKHISETGVKHIIPNHDFKSL